jgi:hypothetical protein
MLILNFGYAIIAIGKRILVCQSLHTNEPPKAYQTLGGSILI